MTLSSPATPEAATPTTPIAATPEAMPAGHVPAIAAFLASQVDALDELDFLVAVPLGDPLHAVEITRLEEPGYAVRIPLRPPARPLGMAHREALDRLGYRMVDAQVALGERRFTQAPEAAAAAATLLRDVFGHVGGEPLDVRHGSRRPERDAARKLATLRAQLEPELTAFLEGRPLSRDPDGDYVVPHAGIPVIVAPRAPVGALPLVRVAAITNLGINPSPEVGMMVANLNFGLAVGRFAFDAEHGAIWFDETLLGENVDPTVLRAAIELVAHMGLEWSTRLAQMFGGAVPREKSPASTLTTPGNRETRKPGEGGYL